MRLPWTKLHRAFPELDRFTDGQCEAWTQRLWASAPWAMWLSVLVPAAIGIAGGVVCVRLGLWLLAPLIGRGTLTLSLGDWLIQVLVIGAWVVVVGGPAALGALLLRDLMVRRVIRSQLRSRACLHCGYSLLGLPISDGCVTCSECGERASLADRGLAPEDLIAPARDEPADLKAPPDGVPSPGR